MAEEDIGQRVDDGATPRRAPSRWRLRVLALLLLLGMVALVAGVPLASRKVPRQEATIVLLVDVSGSNGGRRRETGPHDRGEGGGPGTSRITATHADRRPRDLRDHARLVEEPTLDRGRILAAIDGLTPGGGTALGDALVLGVHAMRPGRDSIVEGFPASVLLLSDGANTVGLSEPLAAADEAVRLEVPVYAVSHGTLNGRALIPDNRGEHRLERVPPDWETRGGSPT